MTQAATTQQELTLTRTFEAPRHLVFRAWTDATQLAQWWGPTDWTIPTCEIDARPGGRIRIVMRGPDPWGDNPMEGQFVEVVEPERLVFSTTAIPDPNGKPQLETLNTITFDDVNGKTRLTAHIVVVRSTPEVAGALAGMEAGWNQQLDKLAALLA